MQPGQIALVVCMAVGGIVVAAAVATHIWECILISRKKKAKQIEDEEKARIASTSPTFASPVYSNFAAKPVAAAGVHAGNPSMKQVFAASNNSQNNGFQPLLSPTSPTLTIRTPLSPSAVYSPLTPTSPSTYIDSRPLLSSAAAPATLPLLHSRPAQASQDNLTHLPPRITRSRLNGFATPPRTSSNRGMPSHANEQVRPSMSQPRVIYARSVSELVGSVSPSAPIRAGSSARKGELRETEQNMQEVGKLGW